MSQKHKYKFLTWASLECFVSNSLTMDLVNSCNPVFVIVSGAQKMFLSAITFLLMLKFLVKLVSSIILMTDKLFYVV